MKKGSVLIMILIMTIHFALAQKGENLVQNGTFEQGNVGFKNDYRFFYYGSFYGLLTGGAYTVMDSFPNQVNRVFNYFKLKGYNNLGIKDSINNSVLKMPRGVNPKRTSTGYFLAVHVNEPGKIWYDSITVSPNTTYSFSCSVTNLYYSNPVTISIISGRSTLSNYRNVSNNSIFANPGIFKFCVNGKKISKVQLSYSNEWRTLSGRFTTGPDQTRVEISIQDQPWIQSVHYAAVDNIVFKPVKKDTTTRMVSVSEDFKKDVSIEEIKVDQKLQLRKIYFERSKYDLLETSVPELNDLAAFMKKYPTVRIRLEGHTDNQGSAKLNEELSEKRVKEVKKYLVEQGIKRNRIEWIGFGGRRPTNNNATEELRQKNRRVEVVIIGK